MSLLLSELWTMQDVLSLTSLWSTECLIQLFAEQKRSLVFQEVGGGNGKSTLFFHGYEGVQLFRFGLYHTCDYLSGQLSVSYF